MGKTAQGCKLGLALSGGGFRAALYHIGVLAQLADRSLLKNIEVISTVSGGSIIGAMYYLHVKQLLETKVNEEITEEDYVNIVRQIEVRFRKVIQSNLFARTFQTFSDNIRMLSPDYSRSDRIGELYDEYLYRPLIQRDSLQNKGMVKMHELLITPKSKRELPMPFQPDQHNNLLQNAKVPVLLLNTTVLNTGSNWRFEAVRMGDTRPSDYDQRLRELDIDKNSRLMRADSYSKIPVDRLREFELGYAVAASSAVPGVFVPVAVSGMYEDMRIQLVDGGVYDNQGVQGLLDAGCTHMIVSDASGQMDDELEPSPHAAQAFSRSFSILGKRLREEQMYRVIEKHEESRLVYIHLRKGLAVEEKPFVNFKESVESRKQEEMDGCENIGEKDFGIHPLVQLKLSNLRTHLDSFSDVEAFSLMNAGYNMMQAEIEPMLAYFNAKESPISNQKWSFQNETLLSQLEKPSDAFLRILSVGERKIGKTLLLSKEASIMTGMAAIALLVWIYWRLAALHISIFTISLQEHIDNILQSSFLGLDIKKVLNNLIPNERLELGISKIPKEVPVSAAGLFVGIILLLILIAVDFYYGNKVIKGVARLLQIHTERFKTIVLALTSIIIRLYLWICTPLFNRYGTLGNLHELIKKEEKKAKKQSSKGYPISK
ncbi:patatin-like phospholipase family protein [Bacillus sp. OTU530]|uniref:patatin-like phospholipase family protein n=1 Tax=Bacillus sp. OTU530 TaxID=3043862 RepID=UPI00313CEE6D